MATLLTRQILVLALVSSAAWLWLYLIPKLPSWLTHEGSKMSLWDLFGILLAYVVAVREATWMATRIKRRFPELEESV